jgi:hypothetical protein
LTACHVLPPARRPFENRLGELRGCPLAVNHAGPHIAWTDDGHEVEWDSDDHCGCCDITDPDRCFWHST